MSLSGFFKEFKKHRIPAVDELISTEEKYVDVLGKVVCGYMKEFYDENSDIPPPDALKDYSGFVIFSYIVEIYEFHKNYFLKALQENHQSARALSNIFKKNEHHFYMYAKFSLNKQLSEHLISTNLNYFEKVNKKLGHRETIADLMIAPVQRITRYPLMLDSYSKHLTKNGLSEDAEYINDANKMLKEIVKKVNEFEALNCIRNFDGVISDQGNLILHGPLICEYNRKRCNFYVYLFKFSVLLTEKQEHKRKGLGSIHNFRHRLPVNQLQLKELGSNKFCLQVTDPNSPSCFVICQTESKMENEKWTRAIRELLITQIDLIHDLVYPSASEDREILL